MTFSRLVLSGLLAAVVLTGCAAQPAQTVPSSTPESVETPTATPTPEPTTPALSELVVTPEGIGSLAIGEEPAVGDPETDLLVFIEGYCQDEIDQVIAQGADDLGWSPDKWVANFEPALSGDVASPFAVAVPKGEVSIIDVADPAIQTAEGIGIGSTRTELLAAYPDASPAKGSISGASELYTVEGNQGRIVMEIALSNDIVGLEDVPLETVWSFRVTTPETDALSWVGNDGGSAVRCIQA